MTARRFAFLTVLLALLVAGCGGGDAESGASSDVASVLPANAPLVAEFNVGKDSEQGKDALAFASKLDPQGRDLSAMLATAVDDELSDDDKYTYSKDIKPWLGDTVMLAVDGFDTFSGVLAAEVTDEDKAEAFIKKASSDEKLTDKEYEGVKYQLSESEGTGQGIIDGVLVAASDEAHFRSAIDASKGKGSLTDDKKFAAALDEAPDERLALGYIDVQPFLALLKQSAAIPPQIEQALDQVPGGTEGQTIVALTADDDEMAIETAGTAPAGAAAAVDVLSDLPASSWIAAGGPLDGANLLVGFEQGLRQAGGAAALGAIDNTGIREFVGGLKNVSLHFGGTDIQSVSGALTLKGTDDAAAAQVVKQVTDQVNQLAAGSGMEIKRVGNTATLDVPPYKATLSAEGADLKLQLGEPSGDKLADKPSFKTALEALDLDDGVASVFVDFQELSKLVASLPSDEDTTQAVQVLSKLGVLVAGSEVDDGTARGRFVLTLK